MKEQQLKWNPETNETLLITKEDGFLTVEKVTSEEASRLSSEINGY